MRSRTRLTITLPPELLAAIDHQVDGRTFRNRSHAIETLLRVSLNPNLTTAVLLAGGKPKEDYLPPLMPIQGQPLIALTIGRLVAQGVRSIVILAGEHEVEIRRLLGDGRFLGADLNYVSETVPLGTAGALKAAERFLTAGPFLVLHADVLTDISISQFAKFHVEQGGLASIAVKPRQAEPSYGKVLMEGSTITNFIERGQEQGISIVNTGVYIFEREVLGFIEAGAGSRLETDVFPLLARTGELRAYLFQGIWYDVSRRGHYQLAQERWREKGGQNHEGEA